MFIYICQEISNPLWRWSFSPEEGGNMFCRNVLCTPIFQQNVHSTYSITKSRHRSLSVTRWIQSITSHLNSITSISILSSHLRLDLPSGVFPWGVSNQNFVRISHLPPHAPLNSSSLIYSSQIIFGEDHKLRISSLRGFLQSPVTLSLSGSNILPS